MNSLLPAELSSERTYNNVRFWLLLVFLICLLITTIFIWYVLLNENGDNELTVTFLDVGQGDAIFIETPVGTQALIDTGSPGKVSQALGDVLPFYDRSLDLLLITHADSDHLGGGPEVLAQLLVDQVAPALQLSALHERPVSQVFAQGVQNEGAQLLTLEAGDVIDLGGEVYLLVLAPDSEVVPRNNNRNSLVLRVVYEDTAFLLTGDAPISVESQLSMSVPDQLKADVLKVGHHGSDTSTSRSFLGFVAPQYAVIQAGADNRYGHPHQSVLDNLLEFNVQTLCTCTEGHITFTSNGQEVVRK